MSNPPRRSTSSSGSSSSSSSGGSQQSFSENNHPPEIRLSGPKDSKTGKITWNKNVKGSGEVNEGPALEEENNEQASAPVLGRRTPEASRATIAPLTPLKKNAADDFLRPDDESRQFAYSSPNLRALNNPSNYEQARLMDSFLSGSINRANTNYVDPLYRQLNPSMGANKNKPVWSLNQPLPHVLDQGLAEKMIQKNIDARSRASSRSGSRDPSRSGSTTSVNDWKRLVRRAASNMKLTDLEAQVPPPRTDVESSKTRSSSRKPPQSQTSHIDLPRHDVSFSLGDESYPSSVVDAPRGTGAKVREKNGVSQADLLKERLDEEAKSEFGGNGGGAGADSDDESEIMTFPNFWAKIRYHMREPFAECFGTLVLVVFGVGGNLQATVTDGKGGSFEALSFAWGFGCMLGVYVAGGISGGHINPAVTISMAIFRKFPWKKVPVYIVAQIFGAFFGGAMAYGYFWSSITKFEGGKDIRTAATTGACLYTDPKPYVTWRNAFFDEFIGAAMLVGCLMALLDDTNAPPANGMTALIVGFLVAAIGMALGYQTSFTINPARDLGPRIFAAMIGYGPHPFHLTSWWWTWGAWGGPIAGGIAGALVYDLFIFTGCESPINYPDNGYIEERVRKFLHADLQTHNDSESSGIEVEHHSNSSDTLVRNAKLTKSDSSSIKSAHAR